jgi:hypothetical protein
MYRTCIYCNRKFGANTVIEYFPVGRRLAFDSERGRLWVICESCRRWNLSPLEERWEAIEECERRFSNTSQSFSTDNIGLARLAEGLELVRIGRPQRREFAAWRYGREFLRRRIHSLVVAGTKVAISVAGLVAGADIFWVFIVGGKKRVAARLRDDEGTRLHVTRKDLTRVELSRTDSPDGWSLVVPYRPTERRGLFGAHGKGKVHSWGGSNAQVRDAVALIEESRNPERLFARVAGDREAVKASARLKSGSIFLKGMNANVRLALEMAAHEESERRALEGELAILEAAWREAEEVASIADRLLIPERVDALIRRWRKPAGSDGPSIT